MDNSLSTTTHITKIDGWTQGNIKQRHVARVEKSIEFTETNTDVVETMISTKDATINLRKVFQYLGLSMAQPQLRKLYVIYSFVLNTLACVGFPIGFSLSYFRMIRSSSEPLDMGLLLTSLQAYINLFACHMKLYTLTWTQHKWRSADAILERLDERSRRSPDEIEEIHRCVRFGNRCAIFYLIAYWAYSSTTLLGAFAVDRPPYNIYIPFVNWRLSRPQFLITSVIEFLLVCVACVQQAFDDSFPVIYVYILRTHIKVLMLGFSKLGKDSSMSLNENFDELKQCIRDHKRYLELYDIIAPIISITLFIQFMVTACVLSTTLVNFMLIATDFYSRIGSFFYIIAIILEILPVCYYAQCLMDDSNRLAEVIFHSNWIDQDVRYRKMLVFLMQRTQCTKNLTAGKLFPINLSCCLSVVKFSFSLYTFIETMGLKEKFAKQ